MVWVTNQAVRWSDFFGVAQAIDEAVGAFFVRCARRIMDCGFQCSSCECNLSEYMLLRKMLLGLRDSALKQEVFYHCHTFVTWTVLGPSVFRLRRHNVTLILLAGKMRANMSRQARTACLTTRQCLLTWSLTLLPTPTRQCWMLTRASNRLSSMKRAGA